MNELLTLQQVRQLKNDVESAVHALISEFENATGITVTQINLTHLETLGGHKFTNSVNIPLNLT
jgi:hypothetical protein